MRSAGFTPRARKLSRSIQAWCSLVKQRASHCPMGTADRKSTRLNSSHSQISYAVFCLKKKKPHVRRDTSPSGPLDPHHSDVRPCIVIPLHNVLSIHSPTHSYTRSQLRNVND